MRLTVAAILTLLASAASAHPGHLVDLAGHDHWVAGAAVGIALGLGVWGAIMGKKKPRAEAADAEDQPA